MSNQKSDLDKITQTVQYYFDGMYNSDTESLKRAFAPEAFLHGYFGGQLRHLPFDAWLKQVEGRPAPSKTGEAYDMKIVSVDITDNIAQVKVFDLYLGKHFTDYLSLIKIDDNWLIMNKMFHHQ
ncbi:MAG: nuclear transport factor 2 family protein [Desulfobacterales bacterium]|jgi:hypothetical protein